MTPQEFDAYRAQGYSRIPLSLDVLADLDTPLSTYLKLAAQPFSYLLESVQGGEKWGRYSIIGLPCRQIIRINGHTITIEESGRMVEEFEHDDPLSWIESYQLQFKVPEIPSLPSVIGGLVGYFGYDTVRYVEPRLGASTKPDPIGTPDILLMVSEEVVVVDNLSGKLHLVVNVDPSQPAAYERGQQRLQDIAAQMRRPVPFEPARRRREIDEEDFVSGFTEEGFKAAVERARQYIVDGDAMQIVLSQRMTIPFEARSIDLYRALRLLNPSPYMYYLDLGDHHVVGSSPEILVRMENGDVTVRPIAGTRPRGEDDVTDQALEEELLADPKELAEHLMLIDLGRNDVGRVSEVGSVRLTEKMIIERYSHVMHIVSNVVGKMRDNLSAMDVLRATFPAGTVSGAPKVRAMEIIDELEPVKRGIYSGSVGYLSWNGNMDTAIAIRTAVIKDGHLNIQAGAGLVYDSVPDNEWAETMNKGRAVFRAAALAERGLDELP